MVKWLEKKCWKRVYITEVNSYQSIKMWITTPVRSLHFTRVNSGIQRFPNIVHCVDLDGRHFYHVYNNSTNIEEAQSTCVVFGYRYMDVSFRESRIKDTGFSILFAFFCKFILAAPLSF